MIFFTPMQLICTQSDLQLNKDFCLRLNLMHICPILSCKVVAVAKKGYVYSTQQKIKQKPPKTWQQNSETGPTNSGL